MTSFFSSLYTSRIRRVPQYVGSRRSSHGDRSGTNGGSKPQTFSVFISVKGEEFQDLVDF